VTGKRKQLFKNLQMAQDKIKTPQGKVKGGGTSEEPKGSKQVSLQMERTSGRQNTSAM
jgi:hypothetical protein